MNRLMIRHTMDKPLPYDAEVEYLESTGTQYIVTDYIDNRNDVIIEIECAALGYPSTHNIFGMRANGTMKTSTSQILLQMSDVYTTGYAYITTGKDYADPQLVGQKNTSMQDLDNLTMYSQRTPTGKNLVLFAFDNIGTILCYSCRIKRMQIRVSGGTILANYISVRKGNTGYLYDKVSGRLFGNQGTGDFIVGPDYNPFAYQYLTFVPLEDSTFSFSKRGTGNDIEYSIDGGAWTALASEANTPTVAAGHNIRWRAELTPSTTSGSQGIGTFSATGLYDAMGNTMSLLYGDNYIGQTTLVDTYTFYQLWRNDTHIHRADRMVLPAKKLTSYCYINMFYGCTSLVTAPELPATTLTSQCYFRMFYGCTSLVTAPELPATTMASDCYASMFYGCTSLVTAPELLATKLAYECYSSMFRLCISLVYVKMLATDISAHNCLSNWLSGVAATGTFVKNAAMTTLPTGTSGIPSGWTVVDDSSTITT